MGHEGNHTLPPRRRRDRHPRQWHEQRLEQLVESLIHTHKLTEAVREYRVYIFWKDMLDGKVASNTTPASLSNGVLSVHARSSTWLHELRFLREKMLAQINRFVGAPNLLSDIRFSLDKSSRGEPVDHDLLPRQRREEEARRPQPRTPVDVPADAEMIRAETSAIEDDELRAIIERVRLGWKI